MFKLKLTDKELKYLGIDSNWTSPRLANKKVISKIHKHLNKNPDLKCPKIERLYEKVARDFSDLEERLKKLAGVK